MLMPVIGLFIIFNSGTHISYIPSAFRTIVYLIVLASSCILPLSLLPLLRHYGIIKSFRMESHRERIIPVAITGLFYFLGYLLLQKLYLPQFLNHFILGSILSLYTSLVVTYWWKISLHMMGIGGVTGAILVLSLKLGLGLTPILVGLFIIAALTATARLYLNAHTPLQTLAGFMLGFIVITMMTL
jgi:membrane-associated phospholipid phosphatase